MTKHVLLLLAASTTAGCRHDEAEPSRATTAPVSDRVIPPPAGGAGEVLVAFEPAAGLAVKPTGELANARAEPAAGIDRENVATLQPAWQLKTPAPVSHAALVDGGALYTADWAGNVYRLDAATGAIVWRDHLEEPQLKSAWRGFAGTGALGGGMLYEVSAEGRAFALDAGTGRVLWQTRVSPDASAGNLGRLLYADGLVYVGLATAPQALGDRDPAHRPRFRGEVLALDARTGHSVWRLSLVDPPASGVAVWTSFAFDPSLGALYFDTGNNDGGASTPLADSVVGVNARTGQIVWSRQAYTHDESTPASASGADYDFAGGPQLFDASSGGRVRELVGAASRSGMYFVYDRRSGEPVWQATVGTGGDRGGMLGEASIAPGAILAWSNAGAADAPGFATVKALDPATGRVLWVDDRAQPASATAGVVAGDVYLVGSLDGTLHAYGAVDGKLLWSGKAPGSILTALDAAGGQLYVGTGAPPMFAWARGGSGLIAYRVAAIRAR